jgi:hypothetical protein
MDSGILLNDCRPEDVGNIEFHATGLTRDVAFAMDKIVNEKREDA